MTFVPWSGLLAGAVAMGNPVAVAMGFLLMGLLTQPPSLSFSGPSGGHGCGIPLSRCNPPQTTVPRPREVWRFA